MIKYILLVLALGGAAGYLNSNWAKLVDNAWVSDYLFSSALLLLLFVMGVAFSVDREAVTRIRKTGIRILVVPFAVGLGTVLGGLVAGFVLGINAAGAMAVSAGFGWYTLAGPLVGQLLGAEWGALALVVNFLRELLTIVTASLASKGGRDVPVAVGGATTMDTTLPVIVRYNGSEALITSFSSGFVLSLVAPFAIIALASLY
jgi:uncharacterized membrane protein YbjE (DUF340 family)